MENSLRERVAEKLEINCRDLALQTADEIIGMVLEFKKITLEKKKLEYEERCRKYLIRFRGVSE